MRLECDKNVEWNVQKKQINPQKIGMRNEMGKIFQKFEWSVE